MSTLQIYNSLTRKKETFEPLNPPFVGLYACGPTVYGEPHLGHARMAITFDLVFRYLKYQDYKVRYVRNITDVGHLENDADEGEDKIAKKARLEKVEPMEIVQHYTNTYHDQMKMLNVLPPSIEPTATGHIIEQITMIKDILEKGFAYISNGSVYFDVQKYHQQYHYGKLSGRKIEDLISNTRELDGQSEKRDPLDFALWKKASPEHIMRWPSEWSDGFPGWHLECSAMGARYLGEQFDIHGGGMDLMFPHHECEIAQSTVANGKQHVRYWMHNNMITLNGQKMGKSLGNAINLIQFFNGEHELLQKSYAPMTIRFFMLQAHYRSTLDFSNEALIAAEKGLERLFKALKTMEKLPSSDSSSININNITEKCIEALNDDFNSPIAIAQLFDGVRLINSVNDGKETLSASDINKLKEFYHAMTFDVLGLRVEETAGDNGFTPDLIDTILNIRLDAKKNKNFEVADLIRDKLTALGIEIKDKKDGFEWELK